MARAFLAGLAAFALGEGAAAATPAETIAVSDTPDPNPTNTIRN